MMEQKIADRVLPVWVKIAGCVILFVIALWLMSFGKAEDGYSDMVWLAAKQPDFNISFEKVTNVRNMETKMEKPLDFTAWEEQGGRWVCTKDQLKTAYDVNVISICGSSENLIPYGKILRKEDEQGCLIGEKTAEALFGSHAVEGLTVCYENREFFIRGVLKEPENVLIVQNREEGTSFSRINFCCPKNKKNHRSMAENFMNRYGIDMAFAEGMENTKRLWKIPSMEELAELIPGKWSDFAGWKRNISKFSNS